jgi:hypothetical protein
VICAPFVFVGTRADVVTTKVEHKAISGCIESLFKSSLAWGSLVGNGELCFFPVSTLPSRKGTKGSGLTGMKDFMMAVESTLKAAEHVNQLKPLSWLLGIDKLVGLKRAFLPFDEARELALGCGIAKEEVEPFFAFLHDMGELMWNREDKLRHLVIVKPIDFFVRPASAIICQHENINGEILLSCISAVNQR